MHSGASRHASPRTRPDPGAGRGERALALLAEVAAQTCSLVAPRSCPCGRDGTRLCPDCAALLQASPLRVDACCDALQVLSAARVREQSRDGVLLPAGVDHSSLLPVLALGEYGGDLQRLVLAWKNGGMLHLCGALAAGLAPAVRRLAEGSGVAEPLLVPVPSRPAARLRRGEDHTAELVRALDREGAGRALLLRAAPTTAQEGRGARARRLRRIRLDPAQARRARALDAPVIVVDDVVTTGATLRGMHEALDAEGIEVLGAAVIASARVPGVVASAGPGEAPPGPGEADEPG